MDKKLVTGAALAIILAGCGSDLSGATEETEQSTSETSDTAVAEGTTEPVETSEAPEEQEDSVEPTENKVIDEVKQQLATGIPVKLPEGIEALMGNPISAATQSDSGSYTVEFYKTDTSVPVNDPSLEDRSDAFAVFTGTAFENGEQAEAQINYQEYTNNGLPEVNLGAGIVGVSEGAAGSQYISWNEGRWALSIRGTTEQGDSLVDDAKTVVQFLEDQLLPAPQRVGAIQLDATDDGKGEQLIAWQEENIVYEITTTESYGQALEFTVGAGS